MPFGGAPATSPPAIETSLPSVFVLACARAIVYSPLRAIPPYAVAKAIFFSYLAQR